MTIRSPSAVFSECEIHDDCIQPYCIARRYRYVLRIPTGLDNDRVALLVAANPSKATPLELDPTLTRWRNYCRDWGYGWSNTVNVRAWRETNPKKLPGDPLAIGWENMKWILNEARKAELVVAGWGKLGGALVEDVLGALRRVGIQVNALKLNSDGSPTHPLFLRASLKPFPMVST